MFELNRNEKDKIISLLKENDDYTIIDNEISNFSIIAYDDIVFTPYKNDKSFVLAKFNKKLQLEKRQAFEYFTFKSSLELCQALIAYDESLHKSYWHITNNCIDYKVNDNTEWIDDIKLDSYEVVDNILIYDNPNYKPELRSPSNVLEEAHGRYTKIDKLYFEILPLTEGNYLGKLLCNNDEVFKEYINYIIYNKKGLKLFLEGLFRDLEKFKVSV